MLRLVTMTFIFLCLLACKPEERRTESNVQGKETPALKSTQRSNEDNPFAGNRQIHFIDKVGGTARVAYEAIKGQKYFPDTKIFIYTTDVLMEGTFEYKKIANTFEHTALSDRIFIWIHLDENRKVVFIKKLISDNIEPVLDRGTMTL